MKPNLSNLEFQSNGTLTVVVKIVNDEDIESTESFTLTLYNPQPFGKVVLGKNSLTIIILDDDLRKFHHIC